MTGNVIDLAVSVILAGAVGLVVKGFLSGIMMPIIGHFSGGIDFVNMKLCFQQLFLETERAVETPKKPPRLRRFFWHDNIYSLNFIVLM